jgi:UDP-2,3-diacylglucosamine pyrophosphatase LpxH
MWRASDIFVVSDLHLAPERNQGLFRADIELSSFFNWILEEALESTVVLNGDIVDFLVIEPNASTKNVFDLPLIKRRASSILDHHPEVFDALSKLALSSRHHLILISGNHDPELIFPEVQQVFESKLCGSDARPAIRWMVNGEAAQVCIGEIRAVIEHGDIYDDWNRIDRDALRRALNLATRGLAPYHNYSPPPGSHLVVEYITPLREKFPWLDILKPEREAVIPILFAFLPAKEQYKLRGMLRPWLASFSRSIVTDIRRTLHPAGVFRTARVNDSPREPFIDWLNSIEKTSERASQKGDGINKLIPKLRKVSVEDNFFTIEEQDSVNQDVAFLLEQGINLVVHGHTHSAKAYKLGKGLYLNDGTWARLMRLPTSNATDEEWRDFLERLSQGKDEGFVRPTFTRITHNRSDGTTEAALMQWSANNPRSLARWRFAPGLQDWEHVE